MKKTFYEKVKEDYISHDNQSYICFCSDLFSSKFEDLNKSIILSHAVDFVKSEKFEPYKEWFRISITGDEFKKDGLFYFCKKHTPFYESRFLRLDFLDFCIENKLDIEYE